MKKPPSKAKKAAKSRRKATSAVVNPPSTAVADSAATPPDAPELEATVVSAPKAVLGKAALKKQDLINQVCATSGMKKKDVKPVVEATLQALGDALAKDQEFNLPPFAKLKIQKVKELSNARVTIARLRRNAPKATD